MIPGDAPASVRRYKQRYGSLYRWPLAGDDAPPRRQRYKLLVPLASGRR